MRRNRTFFAVILLSSSPLFASQLKVTGHASFIAMGKPSAIKICGEGDGVTGSVELEEGQASGQIEFPLDRFSTGIDLRDKHMKDKYLETAKYQNARLELNKFEIKKSILIHDFEQKEIPFSGMLILHGVSKSVNGTTSLRRSKDSLQGEARFEIKLSDYNITTPQYLGIKVVDLVQIKVDLKTESLPF